MFLVRARTSVSFFLSFFVESRMSALFYCGFLVCKSSRGNYEKPNVHASWRKKRVLYVECISVNKPPTAPCLECIRFVHKILFELALCFVLSSILFELANVLFSKILFY